MHTLWRLKWIHYILTLSFNSIYIYIYLPKSYIIVTQNWLLLQNLISDSSIVFICVNPQIYIRGGGEEEMTLNDEVFTTA